MSVYGNKYTNESVIDDIKKNITNINELRSQWSKSADSFVKHKWLYRYIDTVQKEKMEKYYEALKSEDISYADYKRYFKAICKFMGIPADKVIIENLNFSKDKKDKEQDIIAVKYSKGLVKVKIPEDVRLIHVSPADNITELIPSFRSKTVGKYLYPTKRVFFTVTREIAPTKAGLEKKKTTRYTPKQKYTEAYIDPTYADFSSGSIYIETIKPIPVEKFETLMDKLFKKKEIIPKKNIMESFNEEVLSEVSFIDKESIELIKKWKTSNEVLIKKFKTSSLTDYEYENVYSWIDTMKNSDEYKEYKKAFTEFCKFCHILPTGTIIRTYQLTKKENGSHSLYVDYSENTKMITLPEGTKLYHITTVEGIEKLNPSFRGKSAKGYFYDKPRVYFTIRKEMPKFLADYGTKDKMHKYLCKKDIRKVYVDPLVPSNFQGAVYVETTTPIPVEEMGIEKKGIKDLIPFGKKDQEETKKESFDFTILRNFVEESGLEIIDI